MITSINCTTFISPPRSSCSLLYVMENGASAENAVVGNEGILGILLFMGGETTPSRAVVQSAGQGFQKAQLLKDEFPRAGQAMHLLLRGPSQEWKSVAERLACQGALLAGELWPIVADEHPRSASSSRQCATRRPEIGP